MSKEKKNGEKTSKEKWDDIELVSSKNAKPEEEGETEVLDTRKEVRDLASDISEVMTLPDKPKMLEMLFNYKKGNIEQKAYLENLKQYWDAHTQNFRKRAANAIKANAANMDKALIEIRDAAKVAVQEIIRVSEEHIQKQLNQALINCQENLSETLLKIKESDSHPDAKAYTTKKAWKVFTEAIEKIQTRRLIEFDESHTLNNKSEKDT